MKPSPNQLWVDPSGRLVRVLSVGSLVIEFEFVHGKNGRKGRKASMFADSFGKRFKHQGTDK